MKSYFLLPLAVLSLGFLPSCAMNEAEAPAADGKDVAVDVAEEEEEQVSAVYLPHLGF